MTALAVGIFLEQGCRMMKPSNSLAATAMRRERAAIELLT